MGILLHIAIYVSQCQSFSTAVPSGGGYKDNRRVKGKIRDVLLSPEKYTHYFSHKAIVTGSTKLFLVRRGKSASLPHVHIFSTNMAFRRLHLRSSNVR